MAQIEVYLLMFVTIFAGHVKSSTTCFDNDYKYTKYCQYDCCGSSGNQYCCNNAPVWVDHYSPVYPVGVIVGIVIGSLVGLGILIGIIACCCCCCRQSVSATSGQVLQPHTNPAFSVTTTNGTTMPITQLTPGMYAPNYPTFPQMAGGYLPGNAAMNYTYGAPQYTNNPSAAPPPNYDNVANK